MPGGRKRPALVLYAPQAGTKGRRSPVARGVWSFPSLLQPSKLPGTARSMSKFAVAGCNWVLSQLLAHGCGIRRPFQPAAVLRSTLKPNQTKRRSLLAAAVMVPPLGARNDGAQPSVGAPRHKPSPSKSAVVPTHTPAAPRLDDVVGLAGDNTQPEGHGDLRLRMHTPLPPASPPAKPLPSMAVAVLTGGDSTPLGLAEDASAPTTATTSAASSGLNSPLAAFAAARARLARSTRDADRLLHSTVAALDSLHPQAAAACANSAPGTAAWPDDASERGSSPGTSRVSTPRHPALAQVPTSGAAPSSSAVSAVAALHQRNLRLKERMSTTMALCHALHEQVGVELSGLSARCEEAAHEWRCKSAVQCPASALAGALPKRAAACVLRYWHDPQLEQEPWPHMAVVSCRVPARLLTLTMHTFCQCVCASRLSLPKLPMPLNDLGLQNRESMEKVAQLCSSKQRLSKSLQDAQVSNLGWWRGVGGWAELSVCDSFYGMTAG